MKNVKRLLSVLLAVCLLLTGIPMTALAVEPEPRAPSHTGLVLRGLHRDDSQNGWAAVPTDAPEFYDEVFYPDPGGPALGLGDRWFVAAYILGEDGLVQQGPLNPESITVAAGNVTVQSLQNMNEEGNAALGDDADKLLCIAPTEDADEGQTFTLTWAGSGPIPAKTAQYDITMPSAAFYSDNVRDKAHLLDYDLCHADGENTEFYLIVDPAQASWMSNAEITENADKASLTEVSAGVYKITVPAPTQDPYDFNVKVQWTMTDPNDPNNTWTDERNMWMHPAPYTGLVLRGLEWDPSFELTDEQGQPVLDEEGNPVTGAWSMPEIDPDNPLDRTTSNDVYLSFDGGYYVTVHYFDGETLSPPLNVNNLTFTGNVAHPSPSALGERVCGEHIANYLALFPDPQAQVDDEFTISWAMPGTSETYTCGGRMGLPGTGFYRENERSLENLINTRKGGFEYSAQNNTFYYLLDEAILHPDEHTTRTISNVRLEPGARKADITKVGETAWKITLKEPPFEPFDYEINVKCDISQTRDGQPDGGWTEERYIHCYPQRVEGEEIGVIGLGGKLYTVRRTEAGEYIYSTVPEGSPFETETELPEGVTFDPDAFTLTLNNATLNGRVFFPARSFTHGQTPDPKPTLTVVLQGESTINAQNEIGMEIAYANLVFQGDGALTINTLADALGGEENRTLYAPGIQLSGWEAEDYTADLAVTDQVTVNVHTKVNYANPKNYDRFAPCIAGMFQDGEINLIVADSAKLNLNAHGGDTGVRGVANIAVEDTAQLTADVITEFDSLAVGSDADTVSSHASVILNGQKERFEDWLPTLNGKKVEVKGYGELTVNEQADDRSFSPSIFMDKDILDPDAPDGLFIGGHGKVTIHNAHSLIVNTALTVAQDAALTMSNGFGVGLRLESGSEAVINGTVEITQVDNPYDNFCVWQFKGSTMTLNPGSSFTTSAAAAANIPNFGFLTEGKLIVNGGAHSFKATGNGQSYGFVPQVNGVVEVNDGEMTVEGSTAALFTNSTHKHNYFTMDGSMHIVSQDEADMGTELGFVDGIVEGSSPTQYEFYLYRNNNASGGTPVFVQKAKISSVSGTAPKAERATVTLQTASTPSAGARANFTANVNAPINTEALVTVELPSGLSIVSGSITKDSIQQNGTTITQMPVMGPTIVRFTTDTTTAGDFPVTIKVFKDASAAEPIAETTCTLTVRGFDISAPSMVRALSETVAVTGSAAPGATVTLKLAGQGSAYATATVNRLGMFEIDTDLTNAGLTQGTPGEAVFDVYLTPVGGTETKQEKQLTVKYQPNLPQLEPGDVELVVGTTIHDKEDQPIQNDTVFPVDPTTTVAIRKTYPVWPSERKVRISVVTTKVNRKGWRVKQIVIRLRRTDAGEPNRVILQYNEAFDRWELNGDYEFPIGEDGLPKLITGIWMEITFIDPDTGEEIPYLIGPMIAVPIIDPSGFVYEGNEDCRVEGVTAELYYSENEPSDKTAAAGGTKFMDVAEGNPLTTDALGQFAWMVPEGWWQVRFSKDGYNEAHTDWLQVQPIQTGLKIEMTATETAAELVNSIERSKDGKYITVTFSKPVSVDSVTAPTVTGQDENGDPIFDADSGTVVVSAEGKTVEGTFSPANGDGATATKFIFVPSSGKLSPYAISIQAKAGIETYNGGEVAVMAEPYKESGKADGPTRPSGPSVGGDEPVEGGPVENPDGSVTMTETADDGTVTTTTTWPNGKESTAIVTPDGDVDIVVKDASGKTMADVTIPAVVPDTGKKYDDVRTNDWFAENVYKTTNLNLFTGTSATTFSPKTNLDRSMLVTVLYNMSSKPAYGTDVNVFPDIQGEEWYAGPANWAKAMGVAAGTDKGFEPAADITRQDMVTMIYQYAKAIGLNPTESASLSRFKDGAKTADYARPAMQWAVSVGIVSGKGGGVLDPRGNATRAEAASILANFVKYLQK